MKAWKRALLCVLAGLLLVVPGSGAVFAEETEEMSAEEASPSGGGGAKLTAEEEKEPLTASAKEITDYFRNIGEADGYTVWLRPEDYEDAIEEKTARQYADADKAKDAAKTLKEHLKYAALSLIDTKTNQPVAELEEIGKTDKEVICFSRAGRFLVFLNKEKNQVLRIRYRVSTLDNEYLFLTEDRQTLELYSTDYKSIRAVLQPKGEEFYSADCQYRAFLNAERDAAYACVKLAAENEALRLWYDEDTAILALENKENGYIWWSSPLNANRDTKATKLLADELQSSVVISAADRNGGIQSTLRSRTSAELSVAKVQNGVKVTYRFGSSGITVPVTYSLEEEYLCVTTDTADIVEAKSDEGKIAAQLTLLGGFGAGRPEETGYFVIPDGCGALVRFNNGKTKTKSYSAKVYGRDITTVTSTKPAVTEEIYLPVYGIVKEENALAVMIEDGDGNASLNCSISGQSLSSYNLCSFSFQLRGSDTYVMAGNNGASLTVFEDGAIKNGIIRLRYYPIAAKDADYADIAEVYRKYLLNDGGVQKKTEDQTTSLYLDLYGGCMKAHSVLGLPVSMKTSVTGYAQAKEIVGELIGYGVDSMAVVYHNWTDEGISRKVDDGTAPSGTLGGSKDFDALTAYLEEQGFAFYPAVNNKVFRSGNGYHSFTDTAIRISNAYSRQMQYTLSYGVQDATQKPLSLLSPCTFTELYSRLAQRYADQGLTGVSPGEMTTALWGDYGKQSMGRDDTLDALQESCRSLKDAELSLLADGCAAYALPYADRITDAPLQSSGFDVFDEDVPFYQLVLHGVIPCSGTAINSSSDSTNALLTSIAMGCDPSYDMIYAMASDLKDTVLDRYFYAHYAYWTKAAAGGYVLARDVLSCVSGEVMKNYVRDGDISVTTYANGTEIIVDYKKQEITVDGTTFRLEDYEKGV